MKPLNNGRGGARKGAGRKPSGLEPAITVTIRLRPASKQKLKSLAKERGISIGDFIESAVDKASKGLF